MRTFEFYGRERELGQITSFLEQRGAGFTYLRGRRRIGKTEILKRVRDEQKRCFFFMGRADENNRTLLKRFAHEWDAYTGERRLTRLKVSELSWDETLAEVGRGAARTTGKTPFVLLLDEIQWMSKKGVGFCGLLKEKWAEWRKLDRFKLIISGSSNRFFHQNVEGEMAILRGLQTHATIWVRPFTLSEVRKHYFSCWTDEEVCLIYMMLGGVPYYLENVSEDPNFIRAVNSSIFCRGGIYLEEVDSVLKLETTKETARRHVKEILGSLGQDGATESTIVKKTGFRQDSVHKTLKGLLDHGLIRERWPFGAAKKNRSGVRFYMDDFYLNFYFQILRPLESRIRGNERGLLFPAEVLGSDEGYYLRDFTGKAFELLIANIVKEGCEDESARTQRLFEKLALPVGPYVWGTYWLPRRTQIDLCISGLADRELRIIEAKWISRTVDASSDFPEQVLGKRISSGARSSWRRRCFLALSKGFSRGFARRAAKESVSIIELEDLF